MGVAVRGAFGIAIDVDAVEHGMMQTAHLMLDAGEFGPAVEVDDLLEAVLMLTALFGDQPACPQAFVGTGEIR